MFEAAARRLLGRRRTRHAGNPRARGRHRRQATRSLHWDVAFWAERLREQRFDFTDEELRPYFPLERVLRGPVRAGQAAVRRHGASRPTACAPVWHQDVRYFDVADESGRADRRRSISTRTRGPRTSAAARGWTIASRRRRSRRQAAAAGRASRLQLDAARRRQAVADDVSRSRDAVPRVRPRTAAHADDGRLRRRVGHQRRRVGRRRAAQPVHGELVLPQADAAGHDGALRDRRAAAGRPVREDLSRREPSARDR